MPQQFIGIFGAFGFATAAGLNAWVTLLIVSVAGRVGVLTLAPPYDVMSSTPVLLFLLAMTLIEGTADKIPVADHISHIIHIVLQPIAGAILFASQAGVITDMSPVLAFIIGATVAGTIHGARATFRPLVTASTVGIGNPVVSTVEDIAAVTITIGAIIAPLLVFVAIAATIVCLLILLRRWRRGNQAPQQQQ